MSFFGLNHVYQNLSKTFSQPGKLLCGVPQGFISGPFLFLLCINDMPQAVKCELILYADDTCLIFQHNDINPFYASGLFRYP